MLDEVRRALLQEKRQQMQRGYNETVIDGVTADLSLRTVRAMYTDDQQGDKEDYTQLTMSRRKRGQSRNTGSLSLSGIFPHITSGIPFVPGSVKMKPI